MHKTRMEHKSFSILGALLGFFGAANSLIVGIYVVATSLTLSSFLGSEHLATYAYVAFVVTAICSVSLVYGSFLIWKRQARKGGATNLTAGIVFALSCFYFTFLSNPSFLGWLGSSGYFLPGPAIISGAIGCFTG